MPSTGMALTYITDTSGRSRRGAPRGGYYGKFFMGMCRWPLRAPTPL